MGLRFDIQDRVAIKEDVELAMEYYCYLWEKEEQIPHYLLMLINEIFCKYIRRKQFDGALEAAFGFTGKQGIRKIRQRNLNIATDIARYYLRGDHIKLAISKVGGECKLSTTTIADAWGRHKMDGILGVKIELNKAGAYLTLTRNERG